MKKLIAVALAATMIFSITACGNKTAETESSNTVREDAVSDLNEDQNGIETTSDGILVMATNSEFAPYVYLKDDKIVGIDVEIAEAIAADLGMELKIEDMAFNSILEAVQSGKADIGVAGITVTEEHLEKVNFTESYTTAAQVIVVSEMGDVQSLSDLGGKVIGVQADTTGDHYSDEIDAERIERYNKGFKAIQALIQGKISAVIMDRDPAKVFVEQNEGLKIIDEEFAEEEYAIALAKENNDILEKINESLANLKESGRLQEIIDKYIKAE